MPPSTRGTSVDFVYTRRPGFETRLSPEIVRSPVGCVLHRDRELLPGPVASDRRPRSPRCSPPAGGSRPALPSPSTTAWRPRRGTRRCAFRIRVSMSAMGSVIVTARQPPAVQTTARLTTMTSSRRGSRPRAPSRGSRCDTARTCGTRRARDHTGDTGCTARTLNFGVRCCFWTNAFFATWAPLYRSRVRCRDGTGSRAPGAAPARGRRRLRWSRS